METKQEIINMKDFGKVSHEIKTPLNAIIGLINELILKNKQAEIEGNLTSINSLANYLIFLITDLTQYCNNLSYEDIQIFVDKINLKDILNFSFDILNALLCCKSSDNSTKAILNFNDKLNSYVIKSDEIRIKQILLNFISNAVKFTKCGSITIDTKLKPNLQCIKVSIIDTGIGIKEKDMEKLFSENERVKEGSILNRFGSGFGLTISKSLSEKLNINLKFKSKHQEGSTFSLYIPYENKNESFINTKNTPSINIIKTHEKSNSLDGTTRKGSNSIILLRSETNHNKTDSSSNLHGYNVVSERLTKRKSTRDLGLRYFYGTSNQASDNYLDKIINPKTNIERKSNIIEALSESGNYFFYIFKKNLF